MNTQTWLSRLIAFDTVSRHSNLSLIAAVQEWLADHQIASRLIKDAVEPKANLFATIPAANGSVDGGIILSGHTDVVPVDGQTWDSDPFVAIERDGKLYGRGACDMKGFIAVALALIPYFRTLKLKKPIHFAFSYDEEIGCRGAPFMIDELKKMGLRPDACIVGEPTEMRPVVAHKGKQSFRCSVHGVAAHSSLTTKACNAIEHAAKLICFIREMADTYQQRGPYDSHYDVPFTTLTTNLIKGGNAYNTIPALCEFIFEFRNLPMDKPTEIHERIIRYIQDKLLPDMKREHPDADVVLDTIAAAPGLEISEEAALTKLLRQISGEQEILKVAYATEAGLFQEAAIPTIVCGPGSIEQAHRANEYVAMSQLAECERFLQQIAGSLAA